MVGEHRADDGIGPAGERLDADHALPRELELRLVVHRDRADVDRALQRGDEDEPARRLVLDVGRVELAARLGALGEVHGGLGALEEQVRVLGVGGRAGDADGGVDAERRARHVELAAERGEDLLGGARGVAVLGEPRQQDPEAIALHARDEVGGADRALQPSGHLDQHRVALLSAERVVHVAEAVEVDDEEGGLLIVAEGARRSPGGAAPGSAGR